MSAWDSTPTHCCPTSFWPETLTHLHPALQSLLRAKLAWKGAHAVLETILRCGDDQRCAPEGWENLHCPLANFVFQVSAYPSGHSVEYPKWSFGCSSRTHVRETKKKSNCQLYCVLCGSGVNMMHAFSRSEMYCHHVTNTSTICQFTRHCRSSTQGCWLLMTATSVTTGFEY